MYKPKINIDAHPGLLPQSPDSTSQLDESSDTIAISGEVYKNGKIALMMADQYQHLQDIMQLGKLQNQEGKKVGM